MVKKLTIVDVLLPFLSRPDEPIHLADISRELRSPHPTVRLHLRVLENDGLVKKKTKGRLTLFSLNFNISLLIDYLIITEKSRLISCCEKNVVLKEFISFLHHEFSDVAIVLFGSSVNSFRRANDIDLLVIGPADTKKITAFSKKMNKPAHIVHVRRKSEITSTLKKEIIKKHLIVSGSELIVRWMYW